MHPQHIKTNAPDVGTLSPFEAQLVADGDYTISEAMIQRSVTRIRCHGLSEAHVTRYVSTFFHFKPSPEIIADLTAWE